MKIEILEKEIESADSRQKVIVVLLKVSEFTFGRKMRSYEFRHIVRLLKVYTPEDIFDAILASGKAKDFDFPLGYTTGILRNWRDSGMIQVTTVSERTEQLVVEE